jgi:hypothetical protein
MATSGSPQSQSNAHRFSLSRRALLKAGGLLSGAAAMLTLSAPRARASVAAEGQELVGTWVQDVTTPDRRIVNFTTFSADASLIATNSDHLTRSPFHGVWVRTGDRQFAVTQWRLVFDELGGQNVQRQKVRGEITVNETLDEATARYWVEFLDPDGNLVSSVATGGQLRRIKVEAMPDP